jgi:hypothetical protein
MSTAAIGSPGIVPNIEDLLREPSRALDVEPGVAIDLLARVPAILERIGAVQQHLFIAALSRLGEGSDHIVSVKEGARLTGLKVRYIYDHKHELPFTIVNGQKVLCSTLEIDRWKRRNSGGGGRS